MRKLIYIDNDGIERAKEDIERFIKPRLLDYGMDEGRIDLIEIISDFYQKSKDDMCNIIYSKNNAILSWSVYTPTYYSNSKAQMLGFLRTAGNASVKDCVYIDVSGMLYDALSRSIKFDEIKCLFNIMMAIENNYIISFHDGKFSRIRIDLSDYSGDGIKREEINLLELLSK